jgi:predicted RNase H-like HicB family nuclease
MRRQIQFTCQLFREEDQIVSLCPELNVSSFGETPAEAEAALHEAVTLFLEECERMGTLNEVLEEAGYHLTRREAPAVIEEWTPPRPLKTLHLELSLA